MDHGAIKWTRLSCRSFAANAVRLQLHALVTSCARCYTRANQALVDDDSQGEVHQDRREGGEPWPLRRLLDGRSRHSEKPVRRDPAAHRGTTTTAQSGAGVKVFGCHAFEPNPRERCVQMTEKSSACAVGRCSGGQRLPKTVGARRRSSYPAGNRDHRGRFGVYPENLRLIGFKEPARRAADGRKPNAARLRAQQCPC